MGGDLNARNPTQYILNGAAESMDTAKNITLKIQNLQIRESLKYRTVGRSRQEVAFRRRP